MYIHTKEDHNLKSPSIIVPKIIDLFHPKSVLDVGCGIGTWLHVFKNNGISKIKGVDGEYVDRGLLSEYLSEDKFKSFDLRSPFDLAERFDVAICLEVAEHLPEESARGFIESLTKHSNIIVFSSAIPGQGGQNHLNEKDYVYWFDLFSIFNFEPYDLIRPIIWENKDVDYWYKQNIFIFIKKGEENSIELKRSFIQTKHPDKFESRIEKLENDLTHIKSGNAGVCYSFKLLLKAIRNEFYNV